MACRPSESSSPAATAASAARSERDASLSREDWRRLLLLGLPTFGMALSITAVSTYAPVVARGFHASTIAIGLIIGGEGLMALWIPLVVGSRSDRWSRWPAAAPCWRSPRFSRQGLGAAVLLDRRLRRHLVRLRRRDSAQHPLLRSMRERSEDRRELRED